MGCHAFRKFNEKFWKQYITAYDNIDYKEEDENINKCLLESMYCGCSDAQRTARLHSFKKRVIKKRYH